MPTVGDDVLKCSIYLYNGVDDARRGSRIGGVGFLVAVPSAGIPGRSYTYAVTAWHIVRKGATVVRLDGNGTTDIIPLRPTDWMPHPGGGDVAVSPFYAALPDGVSYPALPGTLLPEPDAKGSAIGVGSQCALVARLIGNDGLQHGQPIARFGHVAMMPNGPVENQHGVRDSYLVVEICSPVGHSGGAIVTHDAAIKSPALVGVDCGHIRHKLMVRKSDDSLDGERRYVRESLGHITVLPAARLRELLYDERLVNMRRVEDERFIAVHGPVAARVAADGAKPKAKRSRAKAATPATGDGGEPAPKKSRSRKTTAATEVTAPYTSGNSEDPNAPPNS
jgi:hypothetical protein